jgi:hypothetical protein
MTATSQSSDAFTSKSRKLLAGMVAVVVRGPIVPVTIISIVTLASPLFVTLKMLPAGTQTQSEAVMVVDFPT